MTKIKITNSETEGISLTNEQNITANVTDFDPSDLLAGALAKCTDYEVRKFAKYKGIDLQNLEVNVDLDRDNETKTANFEVHLNVEGDINETQLRQIKKAAQKSYINRLLSNNISLEGNVIYKGETVNFE